MHELRDRIEIHARVIAHRTVWTGAGLHADDALRITQTGEGCPDMLGVFLREDVVGDDQGPVARCDEHRDERLDESGLARPDRSADADAGDAGCADVTERVL